MTKTHTHMGIYSGLPEVWGGLTQLLGLKLRSIARLLCYNGDFGQIKGDICYFGVIFVSC